MEVSGQARGPGAGGQPLRGRRVLVAGAVVFAFWLVVSASLALPDLALGAALAGVLGWWSVRFLWAGETPWLSGRRLLALGRFLAGYSLQMLLAALHVARVVLDPRLPIRPAMVVCRTGLESHVARIAFAQAVTLTPGTLTVDMNGGDFLIHCLDEEFARRIQDGKLARRIAQVFGEEGGP